MLQLVIHGKNSTDGVGSKWGQIGIERCCEYLDLLKFMTCYIIHNPLSCSAKSNNKQNALVLCNSSNNNNSFAIAAKLLAWFSYELAIREIRRDFVVYWPKQFMLQQQCQHGSHNWAAMLSELFTIQQHHCECHFALCFHFQLPFWLLPCPFVRHHLYDTIILNLSFIGCSCCALLFFFGLRIKWNLSIIMALSCLRIQLFL